MEIYRGLILVSPHGDYIADGTKTMIIKSLYLPTIVNKPLLLIQQKKALGIIYLGNIQEIKKSEFNSYYKYHLVTKRERNLWWPNKTVFYLYPIIKKKIFLIPVPVQYPQGPQILILPENIHLKQKIYIGTSGYYYDSWNETYYPPKVNKLEYYASEFNSLEINNSFYKIVDKNVWTKWFTETPSNFTFTAKVYRGITQFGKFDLLKTFWNNAKHCLPKLKCILFQFNKNFKFNVENVKKLEKINVPIKCAFEFRNDTWFNEIIYDFFKKRKWTIVITYMPNIGFMPKLNDYTRTSNFMYFRLHGSTALYSGSHSARTLSQIAHYIRNDASIEMAFIYFNNTDSTNKKIPDAIYDAEIMKNKYIIN
jgi:uncharacterized protein YecE (DUF72 family)